MLITSRWGGRRLRHRGDDDDGGNTLGCVALRRSAFRVVQTELYWLQLFLVMILECRNIETVMISGRRLSIEQRYGGEF